MLNSVLICTVLLLSSMMTLPSAALVGAPIINITMYSVAQCPCSAQFVADIAHIMAHPAFSANTDFTQYFVPKCMDAIDTCDPRNQSDFLSCVHGAEECLGHRYFLCAQAQAGNASNPPPAGWGPPRYRETTSWLDFQRCSYGQCQLCDVFTELFCFLPCKTYTNFTKPHSNEIMKRCALDLGFDWSALQRCVDGHDGDVLQTASAAAVEERGDTYGTKGLPVVTVASSTGHVVRVTTTQKVPLFCGPTPLEVLRVICSAFPSGASPAVCSSTRGLCSVIANATRLPDCR
eukprot:m.71700 g.71700  ORF g.71700 m.71700 type:complete len:290 (-) comp10077_c0_seq2:1224-2093(-)